MISTVWLHLPRPIYGEIFKFFAPIKGHSIPDDLLAIARVCTLWKALIDATGYLTDHKKEVALFRRLSNMKLKKQRIGVKAISDPLVVDGGLLFFDASKGSICFYDPDKKSIRYITETLHPRINIPCFSAIATSSERIVLGYAANIYSGIAQPLALQIIQKNKETRWTFTEDSKNLISVDTSQAITAFHTTDISCYVALSDQMLLSYKDNTWAVAATPMHQLSANDVIMSLAFDERENALYFGTLHGLVGKLGNYEDIKLKNVYGCPIEALIPWGEDRLITQVRDVGCSILDKETLICLFSFPQASVQISGLEVVDTHLFYIYDDQLEVHNLAAINLRPACFTLPLHDLKVVATKKNLYFVKVASGFLWSIAIP